MLSLKIIQTVWITILFAWALLTSPSAIALTFIGVHAVICLGLWKNRPIAWVSSPLFPALVTIWSVPIVVRNLVAFFSGDPLYLDSPATIFVVLVFTLTYLVPAAFILALSWLARQQFTAQWSLLRNQFTH